MAADVIINRIILQSLILKVMEEKDRQIAVLNEQITKLQHTDTASDNKVTQYAYTKCSKAISNTHSFVVVQSVCLLVGFHFFVLCHKTCVVWLLFISCGKYRSSFCCDVIICL